VQHAMRDLMPDRPQRPVDMPALATAMAIFADQPRPAIEAHTPIRTAGTVRIGNRRVATRDNLPHHCDIPR